MLDLFERGVQHIFAIDVAHAGCPHRAHEWKAGKGQGGGGGNESHNIGFVFKVIGKHRRNDLGFVLVAIGEKRAQRAVDQAGNERFLFRRATFTLEIAAGNLARSIGFFLIIYGQGEEVDAGLGRLGTHNGGQNSRFAIGHENRAISLTCHAARLDAQGSARPFEFFYVNVEHGNFPSICPLPRSFPAASPLGFSAVEAPLPLTPSSRGDRGRHIGCRPL